MLIQRITTTHEDGKHFHVYIGGEWVKTFTEVDHGCTAEAQANELIEDESLHYPTVEVKWS